MMEASTVLHMREQGELAVRHNDTCKQLLHEFQLLSGAFLPCNPYSA